MLAILLETVLLLRMAAIARAGLRAAERSEEAGGSRLVGRWWNVVAAILLAMMGFALLGAFLVRLG